MGLDTRTEKDGKHPVRFRISINRTSAYIYTGVYASKEEYTGDRYAPISRRAYMARERSERISRIARKYDEVRFALEDNGMLDNITANELRDYIVEKRVVVKKTIRKAGAGVNDFLSFFDEYASTRNTPNTIKHYQYVWRVLCEYCRDRGIRTLAFDEIDYARLVDLKQWVRGTGRGEPTRFKIESYVRAAYREGAIRYKISRDADPFYQYHIERVPDKDIVSLSEDTIRRLLSLDLTNQQGEDSLERTRDILVASFCLGGANLIDMYQMRKPIGNEAVFVRNKVSLKTQRATRIYIEPELADIIIRNAGEDHLFYWGERYQSYTSFQRKTNERCKRISRLLGTTVNLELIRRSFATIAASLEVPSHVIDKLMGHTDQSVLDRYYAKFDWNIARTYNHKVISYIMQGVEPNSIKVPKLIKEEC